MEKKISLVVLCRTPLFKTPLLALLLHQTYPNILNKISGGSVIDVKTLALASQPLLFLDKPCKKSLKASIPDLYCDKFYMECYNFYQKCKDYFATTVAEKQNRILFAATFPQNQALFQ